MEFKTEQQHWDSLELLYKKFQVPDFLPGTVYTLYTEGCQGIKLANIFCYHLLPIKGLRF